MVWQAWFPPAQVLPCCSLGCWSLRTCCSWEDIGKGSAGVMWPPSAPEPPNCVTARGAAARSPPSSRRGSPSHTPVHRPIGATKPLLAFTPIPLFLEESKDVNLTKPGSPGWQGQLPSHGHHRTGHREKQPVQPPRCPLSTKLCANTWSTASLPRHQGPVRILGNPHTPCSLGFASAPALTPLPGQPDRSWERSSPVPPEPPKPRGRARQGQLLQRGGRGDRSPRGGPRAHPR